MKEFFEAFNIKAVYIYKIQLDDEEKTIWEVDKSNCRTNCEYCGARVIKVIRTYPPITSDIVLRLIGILTKKNCNITLYWGLPKLTEQILKQCIRDAKDKEVQAQVRALFNEL